MDWDQLIESPEYWPQISMVSTAKGGEVKVLAINDQITTLVTFHARDSSASLHMNIAFQITLCVIYCVC